MLGKRSRFLNSSHCMSLLLVCSAALNTPAVLAEASPESEVVIETNFPGGNALVTSNSGREIHLEPDLRGGRPWFYWCFAARAHQPGRVRFIFPKNVAGFQNGAIGFQGPAISTDQGLSWSWMGTENVMENFFTYEFQKPNETIRFAVTIPYLQADLGRFLERQNQNPHLKRSVLTKSLQNREVELLQIGSPAPNKKPMLVTGRHHATETMASYVLEGFLEEAISDSPEGAEFRKNYLLFAVPFVDKDGVEVGDQGKNRKPHDHNRDYGEVSLYPEIQAIKALDNKYDFRHSLDFHCPTLVMQDHQVMHFVGAKNHPRYNFENVSELATWIKAELPEGAPVGPLVWLRDAESPTPMNSHYFGFQAGSIFAATIEFPFSPPGKKTEPESCRDYGRAMLRAWNKSRFVGSEGE